jgi:hypothetical protein
VWCGEERGPIGYIYVSIATTSSTTVGLSSQTFQSQWSGISICVLPESRVHESWSWTRGRSTHRRVWYEDDLRSQEYYCSHTLGDVIVTTSEDPTFQLLAVLADIEAASIAVLEAVPAAT